jgi:hypothetical protein
VSRPRLITAPVRNGSRWLLASSTRWRCRELRAPSSVRQVVSPTMGTLPREVNCTGDLVGSARTANCDGLQELAQQLQHEFDELHGAQYTHTASLRCDHTVL